MDETFQVFHRVLAIAGVPMFAKTKWDSKPWLLWQIFGFMCGFLAFVGCTGFVIVSYTDIMVWFEGACVWNTGFIMFISLAVCLAYRRKFRKFLNEMVFQDGMLEMPIIEHILKLEKKGTKLNELKTIVVDSQEKLLKYARVLIKTYFAVVWLCAVLYISGPVYQMCVNKDENLRLLAFGVWFPWSLQDMRVYIASFIFHAYGGILCCITYPGLQSTIILLISQIIRQLKILSFILLHLDELMKELVGDSKDQRQAYCTIVLSQCVDHYVKLKRFSNRLNVICRPFYLALILDAIMLVCVCSVKIAMSNKLSLDTMKYYVHELIFILMVLMFCSLGQQVQNQCEELEQVVTEKWYIYNKKHQVNIRIFKMALSQRMPIYIFGSITLSLPTFTWFIRTGMSFFTLAMSVLEEGNVDAQ